MDVGSLDHVGEGSNTELGTEFAYADFSVRLPPYLPHEASVTEGNNFEDVLPFFFLGSGSCSHSIESFPAAPVDFSLQNAKAQNAMALWPQGPLATHSSVVVVVMLPRSIASG